jgi:outer membrane protein OmpA-like peptidoglycan-associated protein
MEATVSLMTFVLSVAIVGSGGPGTSVLPLMKVGQGARASAMGESFTGLADDASALYWNPAGLGRLDALQLALSHHEWFAGIRDEVLHAAFPVGPGAFGLGVVYSGEPNVEYWDEVLQAFATCRTWNAVVSAGYGIDLARVVRLGATVKGTFEDLKTDSRLGGGFDIGAAAGPYKGFGFGLACRHVGAVSAGEGTEPLPAEVAAGASYGAGPVRVTTDAVFPLVDSRPNFRAGVEFSPVPALALRVGYRTGPVHLSSLGALTGLTAGLGVTLGGFGIDYAFVPYGELGVTHRVGIRTALERPSDAGLVVIVLDAETRARLNANLAVSGAFDTTAVAATLTALHVRPGRVFVRATLDGYFPNEDTLLVVAGHVRQDTMLLMRLKSSLAGGIYDAGTKRPIGGVLVYSGPVAGREQVGAASGQFALSDVPPGQYVLDASGPTSDYLPQTARVDVLLGQDARQDFYLWRRGDFLVLEGVNFETGKADIRPEFCPTLDRAGAILAQTPTIKRVEVAGHTDPRDIHTTEFPSNRELSDARAEAVRRYLVEKSGIAPDRLTSRGYADTQPVSGNETIEGMAKNRRTELRIVE